MNNGKIPTLSIIKIYIYTMADYIDRSTIDINI